jgi:hypothetical protein
METCHRSAFVSGRKATLLNGSIEVVTELSDIRNNFVPGLLIRRGARVLILWPGNLNRRNCDRPEKCRTFAQWITEQKIPFSANWRS